MLSAQNIKISRDDKRWEIEVKAEIPAEALARYREEALKELQKTATLDGFRPGKAPLDRILQVYGEATIVRRAAENAIRHELPEILAQEKAFVVETPRVESSAPEPGKPLSFTARAGLVPEVKLADYRAIAAKLNAKKEDVSVSDEEHGKALTHLRRERARIDRLEQGLEPQKAAEAARALEEKELPALDEAFVQSIGYETLEAFERSLRENMRAEKESQERQKRRTAILDELAEKSTLHFPAIMRAYEMDDMEARMSEDLARMGGSFDQYLAETKKTREQLLKEWEPAADKRAKIRLILNEIGRQEKIEPDAAEVEREVTHARDHYKDADPAQLKAGVAHALRNEAVLRFLENL